MFVIARTAKRRPTLMHILSANHSGHTICGVDISPWSRAYFEEPIPQVLCQRCSGRGVALEAASPQTAPGAPQGASTPTLVGSPDPTPARPTEGTARPQRGAIQRGVATGAGVPLVPPMAADITTWLGV